MEWSLVPIQLQSAGTDKYFCLTADDFPILVGRGFSACLTIQEKATLDLCSPQGSSRADRELGVLMGAGRKLVFPLISPCEDRFFKGA